MSLIPAQTSARWRCTHLAAVLALTLKAAVAAFNVSLAKPPSGPFALGYES
jgi:hypothetical protein